MRRLLLAFAIAAAAVTFTGSAKAYSTPCFTYGSGPYGGICFHWGDTNRANLTHVTMKLRGPNWSTAWQTDVAGWAATQWSSVGVNRLAIVNDFGNGCPNVQTGGTFPQPAGVSYAYACVNNYSYVCAGITVWLACTTDWVFGQYDPATNQYVGGPHIYASEADFKLNAVWADGVTPWNWTQDVMRKVGCHEIAGHGLGGSHVGGASPNPPAGTSCLYYQIDPNSGINTLGGQVTADENAWSNHNDSQAQTGLWDIRWVKAHAKRGIAASAEHRLRLLLARNPLLYRQAGIPFKAIPVTRAELAKKRGLLPVGYVYVVKIEPEAVTGPYSPSCAHECGHQPPPVVPPVVVPFSAQTFLCYSTFPGSVPEVVNFADVAGRLAQAEWAPYAITQAEAAAQGIPAYKWNLVAGRVLACNTAGLTLTGNALNGSGGDVIDPAAWLAVLATYGPTHVNFYLTTK